MCGIRWCDLELSEGIIKEMTKFFFFLKYKLVVVACRWNLQRRLPLEPRKQRRSENWSRRSIARHPPSHSSRRRWGDRGARNPGAAKHLRVASDDVCVCGWWKIDCETTLENDVGATRSWNSISSSTRSKLDLPPHIVDVTLAPQLFGTLGVTIQIRRKSWVNRDLGMHGL